jgi:hypothetical protein
MAKFATFDDSDFQEFVATFEDAAKGEAVGRAIEEALSKTSKAALSKVRRLTPSKSGHLKRNWNVSNIKRNGKSFTIEFYNNVEYAPYVEYGHRIVIGSKDGHKYTAPINGGFRRLGKLKTVGYQPGVFMLKKTIDATEKTFYKNAGQALEYALEDILS